MASCKDSVTNNSLNLQQMNRQLKKDAGMGSGMDLNDLDKSQTISVTAMQLKKSD